MSKPRYIWWSYAKAMIMAYPGRLQSDGPHKATTEREIAAVRQAIEETRKSHNGDVKMQVIDLLFWQKAVTLDGASEICYISPATAARYHRDFIRLVGKNFGLMD